MAKIEPDNTEAPPKHTNANPAEVTGDSARQGPAGRRVLYVLMASFAMAVAAAVVLYIGFWDAHIEP